MQKDVVTRKSEDGHEYGARTVPTNVDLEVFDYFKHESIELYDAFPVHHFYVLGSEIKQAKLPLWEANPREPSRTGPVRAMETTLTNQPEDFVKKNNGMTLICDQVSFDPEDPDGVNGTVGIKFSKGEGICNGGHTYFALVSQIPDHCLEKSLVRIEAIDVGELENDEKKSSVIVDISSARNTHKQLQDRSISDQLGHFDIFKQQIDNKMISWREGDANVYDDAITVVNFIGLLSAIDPGSYEHTYYNEGGQIHKRPVTGPGSTFTKWANGVNPDSVPLDHLLPVVNDMFFIRDMISWSLHPDSDLVGDVGGKKVEIKARNFYKEYVKGGQLRNLRYGRYQGKEGVSLENPLDKLIIGLFRTNMWCSNRNDITNSDYLGWFVENDGLWHEQRIRVLDELSSGYIDADSDKKDFVRETSPYKTYVYSIGAYQQERPPELIRDFDGNKFVLVIDPAISTHGMHLHGTSWSDNNREISLERFKDNSDYFALYREYDKLDLVIDPEDASHVIPNDDVALRLIGDLNEKEHRYYKLI